MRIVDEYAALVAQKIPVNDEWDEELNNISSVRELIHGEKGYINAHIIKKLDNEWQSHILATKDESFIFSYPREEVPKSSWWAWIDQLEELTPEERSTL